ncbi:hypothetical protein ACLOJK_014083 [Asimina triloba]
MALENLIELHHKDTSGLPFWLHDVPEIVFRSDNEPFKVRHFNVAVRNVVVLSIFYMHNFTTKIVNLMKENGLYASQGGPIILSQIENEYQNVEGAFHEKGPPYVKWAAEMAVGQKTGVPWVMCKQDDAPDPVVFGGEPYLRSAEDIAFAVALFIGKNGSFVNYYMYHGGTNFGRAASAYVTTAYYDQAPLDEYGIVRQPKWGHLKDLHAAVKRCSTPLLFGKPSNFTLGDLQQAFVFEKESGECAAFLANSDRKNGANVMFRDSSYELPPRSISILPDCKNVVFNTAKANHRDPSWELHIKVSVQSNVRSSTTSENFDDAGRWKEFQDVIPNYEGTPIKAAGLLEQMSTTKDSSDYLWYTFSFDYKSSDDDKPLLQVNTRAHSADSSLRKFSRLKQPIMGISGGFIGRGVENLYLPRSEKGAVEKYRWNLKQSTPYVTHFATPDGSDPIALNLASMGKGEVWINGESIGRYWVSFHTPKGEPSQTLYHIPRCFLKPAKNLLVLLEESGGDPLQITLETISVSRVCGHVSDSHPNRSPQHRKMPHVVQLKCPPGKTISAVKFASFGTPIGSCNGRYSTGSCHSEKSGEAVEKVSALN